MENHISARDARKLMDDINISTAQEQLDEIFKTIKKTALDGKNKCYYYKYPMPSVENELRRLGYKTLQHYDQKDGDFYIIEW